MKKILFLLSIFSLLMFISSNQTEAAKKFIPKKNVAKKSISSNIPVKVSYRPDKLGLLLAFSNFKGIETANYSFTYSSNGIPQGVGGTITSSNNPTSARELLFGTCSSAVCTYHSNLLNAKISITAKFANGRTITKNFRIKTYR